MQGSFKKNNFFCHSRDNANVNEKLYATNYNMKDGQGKFDQYLSTQAESYNPIVIKCGKHVFV